MEGGNYMTAQAAEREAVKPSIMEGKPVYNRTCFSHLTTHFHLPAYWMEAGDGRMLNSALTRWDFEFWLASLSSPEWRGRPTCCIVSKKIQWQRQTRGKGYWNASDSCQELPAKDCRCSTSSAGSTRHISKKQSSSRLHDWVEIMWLWHFLEEVLTPLRCWSAC